MVLVRGEAWSKMELSRWETVVSVISTSASRRGWQADSTSIFIASKILRWKGLWSWKPSRSRKLNLLSPGTAGLPSGPLQPQSSASSRYRSGLVATSSSTNAASSIFAGRYGKLMPGGIVSIERVGQCHSDIDFLTS